MMKDGANPLDLGAMGNRNLTPKELEKAQALLAEIRGRLDTLSGGD